MKASALDELLSKLDETGAEGRAAREYLVNRRVRVSLRNQPTGARWTPFGHIELNPSQLSNVPYALSLIVHETCHLKQGIFRALSVQGELAAWQEQFAYLKSLMGKYSNLSSREILIEELMSLSTDNRADLRLARILMQKYAGGKYHINWLPLYPLGREIRFRLTGGK